MTAPPATVSRAIDSALRLIEREASLRDAARSEELIPGPDHQQEAARLFRRASAVRRQRMALLERCGLTR
ncbi:MAG TPA: hypothetical protein VEW95_09255 [Candidatus Limnocylindrales bacterium]|nr:hypothetical protein [Candidatus Limnocylindrales bacterium]